ncbi:MAG: hypothetical protein AAFS02_07950 [Pseudomonadota bacterium]
MAIQTIEFGRPTFCLHEKFILHYASRGLPIPAEPNIASDLIADGFIELTKDQEVYRLTERGADAYRTYRVDIARAIGA